MKDTERLMITEMRRLQTAVQAETFERNGFKKYLFITAGDERVCPECAKLHGQHFKVSEMRVGENAPPMHPSCHCSVAAWSDKEKYNRWIEALANGEDVRWDEFEADEGVDYNGIPKAWKYTGAISTSDALKRTNPHYLQSIPEYLKGTRDDYSNNCANCVPAYEMRKRGYAVTACSVGENRRLKHKPFTAWKDRQPETATGNGFTEILEFIGNSSDDMRVEIAITFKSRGFSDSNSGHVFIAEKEGGKIQFLDPQSGRIISKNIFKNVRENATMYMRIDDLEISDRGVTACKVGE